MNERHVRKERLARAEQYADLAGATPTAQPGETTVRAAVTVTWSLHPR